MRIGPLRHIVRIEQNIPTRGTAGSMVEDWVEFATVHAQVEPIAGREYTTLRAGQAEITTRFRMRYCDGVLPTMRIVWRGKNYYLSEVIDVGAQSREMEIYGTAEVV